MEQDNFMMRSSVALCTVCLQVRDVIQFEILNKQEERWGWMGGKEGIIKPKLEWSIQT